MAERSVTYALTRRTGAQVGNTTRGARRTSRSAMAFMWIDASDVPAGGTQRGPDPTCTRAASSMPHPRRWLWPQRRRLRRAGSLAVYTVRSRSGLLSFAASNPASTVAPDLGDAARGCCDPRRNTVGRMLVREGSNVDPERCHRFDVEVDRDGLIRVCGELDCATAPTLAAVLQPLSSSGGDIDVDLSDVGFIGSAGINVLCAAAHALGTRGRIVVCNPSSSAKRVIEIAAVGAVLHAATDRHPDSSVSTGPSSAADRTTPATSENSADRPASPDTSARVEHRRVSQGRQM